MRMLQTPRCCARGGFRGGLLALLFIYAPNAWLLSAAGQQRPEELAELSIEQLMNLKVSSAAKKEQSVANTAAAVYVITQEDIRRSGVNTLPEALRLAPGVEVAQISANSWAITIRGFNDRYANKLLVLIDGRSVYTPMFAGVYWDLHEVVLEDVERIEVIRGPGASLWGANAVNGVIHVVTKGAAATQGTLLSAGGGTPGRATTQARFGGGNGGSFAYRMFGKSARVGQSPGETASVAAGDGWNSLRAGFRADWTATHADSVSFSGDIYRAVEHLGVSESSVVSQAPRAEAAGGFLLGRWEHRVSEASAMVVQVSVDRMMPAQTIFRWRYTILDAELQQQVRFGGRHEIVWGAGGLVWEYGVSNTATAGLSPEHGTRRRFNAFLQDEFVVVRGKLWLLGGSKIESNPYTGFEAQPSVRLRFQPAERHTLWAAVSRAVRTPSDYEDAAHIVLAELPPIAGLPASLVLFPSTHLRAEQLLAYEVGHRVRITHAVSADWTAFHQRYRDLIQTGAGPPRYEAQPSPRFIVPLQLSNAERATVNGLEVSINYRAKPWWRLSGSYSLLRASTRSALDPAFLRFQPGDSPRHQSQVRSYVNLPRGFEWDTAVYTVGALPRQSVPAYTRLDTRFGWRRGNHLEISAALQNLLQPRHAEWNALTELQGASRVGRAAFVNLTWRF